MEFSEFEKIVAESLEGLSSYASDWDAQDGFSIENGKIVQRHIADGAHGGNCWGDEASYYHNTHKTQPFIPLDRILEKVSPSISYLKYREIEGLIVHGEEREYEYYGNHTNYDVYSLDIEKLYDSLFPLEG